MAFFKKKPKEEFVKTEPTPAMVKEEVVEEEIPSEEVEEEVLEEESEEETDEEEELKRKLEDIQKKKEELKKQKEQEQPKVMVRERAVPVEFMFNNLSDRIEGIEVYLSQYIAPYLVELDKFLKSKYK